MGNSSSTSHDDDLKVHRNERDEDDGARRPSPASDPSADLCKILIRKSEKHDVGSNISGKTFERYFSSEKATNFKTLLFNYLCYPNHGDINSFITGETFLRFARQMRNPVSEHQLNHTYILMFSRCKPTLDRRVVEEFFRTCFLLEAEMEGSKYACNQESLFLASVVDAISVACVNCEKSTTVECFQRFLQSNFPHLIHSSLHRWLVRKVTTVQPLPSNIIKTDCNGILPKSPSKSVIANGNNHHSEDNDHQLHPVLIWLFYNALPVLYTKKKQPKFRSNLKNGGQYVLKPQEIVTSLMKYESGLDWELLYSTSTHGHSMNRLQHHVFAYRGPTAMIVKTDGDVMLCVTIDHEWRERVPRWGGNQCGIMQITPCFKNFESGDKLMYFNLTTRGYPLGLHVGKNPKNPVLEIDQELCVAKVEQIPYRLELLEIWGCSGCDAKEDQMKHKKWEQCQTEKHKKINLNKVDWNENPDRYILELAGRPSYGVNFKR